MAKSYDECVTELIQESLERIEMNPSIEWEEAAREAIKEEVLSNYSTDTHIAILEISYPPDEWEVYCDDMNDYTQVLASMAYVAIQEDVFDKLCWEHGFE